MPFCLADCSLRSLILWVYLTHSYHLTLLTERWAAGLPKGIWTWETNVQCHQQGTLSNHSYSPCLHVSSLEPGYLNMTGAVRLTLPWGCCSKPRVSVIAGIRESKSEWGGQKPERHPKCFLSCQHVWLKKKVTLPLYTGVLQAEA